MDEIVSQAKRNLAIAKDIHMSLERSPNVEWLANGGVLLSQIDDIHTVNDAIRFAQNITRSGINHRQNNPSQYVALKYGLLARRFPDFDLHASGVEDSPLAMLDTVMDLNGRTYSNIFFWHLEAYLTCIERLNEDPFGVLEIGAGMGELCRIFRIMHPEVKYVIVDIPTTLFSAEVFLRANFPDANIHYVLGKDETIETWEAADVLLMPACFAENLYGWRFDFAINQGSMQEMQDSAVRFYKRLIDKTCMGFYSLNYEGAVMTMGDERWREIFKEYSPEVVSIDASDTFVESVFMRR